MADTNWQDFPDSAYFDPADILLLQRGAGGINVLASALVGKRSDGKFLAQGTSDNAPTLGARKGIIQFAGADAAYGLQIGVDAASGASWLQSQRVDGAATAYNLLLNPAGGNVGIGTTSPGAKLDVAGAIKGGTTGGVAFQMPTNGAIRDVTAGASNMYFDVSTGGATHGAFLFRSSNTFDTRMVIDGGGNVGIGTASPGAKLHVAAGDFLLDNSRVFQWKNSTGNIGAYWVLQGDNNFVLWVRDSAGNNQPAAAIQTLAANGNGAFEVYSYCNVLRSSGDNYADLGGASRRWKTVYAVTGSINTSDERAKDEIDAVPGEWLDAWGAVEWVRYKFKDAIEEKGDAARWHIGLVAQRVRDVFAARGLDAREIGLLCYDEWQEERAPVFEDQVVGTETVVVDQLGTGILGPDGAEIMRDVTEERDIVESVQTGERVTLEAGDRWGLRYDECQAMEAAWQRREMARKDAMIAQLADRLAVLEAA